MKQARDSALILNGNWRTWAGAITCTLALNLALFALIPTLMNPSEPSMALGPMIPQIQLTRLKRKTMEPIKKKPKPRVAEKQAKTFAKPRANQPAHQALALPFEINTRLPGGPQTLELPHVMEKSLSTLNLATLFSPGDLDQPLTVLSRIPPIYPFKAKHRGIQGWVDVEFVVTDQGLVEEIKVIAAQPEKIFDKSVIQCLSAWRFKPGTILGEPVKTVVRTRIRFKLN